jgi:Mg2+ and Co2+ transporter CorA
VFFFDSDSFDPLAMQGGEASLVSSRSHGLQLVTLPHKLLQIHSTSISRQLARIIGRVRDVETRLERADEASSDLGAISRALHSCTAELVYLERRSRFEQSIVEAIDTIVAKSRLYTGPWPAMAPQRNALSSRNFEFESLPRRIENARATINTLIQQRNEQISIELTQASFRIAAATLSDARSMKTIAILTMVLLPATTVASIFSMNLFDWFAVKGDRIASKWLWIYWVITIPLTALILLAWWVWNRQGDRHVHQIVRSAEDGNASRIEDIDGLGLRSVGSMQTLSARTKRD